jgi:hypothetical protein
MTVYHTETPLFLNFIQTVINVHYNHLSFSVFLAVYPCFAFKKYTGTSKFPFRALLMSNERMIGES